MAVATKRMADARTRRRDAAWRWQQDELARVRAERLLVMAGHVLCSGDDAARFMAEPHPMLGGCSPEALAQTEAGGDKVERLHAGASPSLPAATAIGAIPAPSSQPAPPCS